MKLSKKIIAFIFGLGITAGVGIPLIYKEKKRRKNQKILQTMKKQAMELCSQYCFDFNHDDTEKIADCMRKSISKAMGLSERDVEVYEEVKGSGKLKVLIRPDSWVMTLDTSDAFDMTLIMEGLKKCANVTAKKESEEGKDE